MDKFTHTFSKGLIIFFDNIRGNMLSVFTITTLIFFYLAVFSVNYSATKAIDKLTDIKTISIFIEEGVEHSDMLNRLSKLQMPVSFKLFDKQAAKDRVMKLVPGAKNIEKLPVELFPEFIEMTMADYAAQDGLVFEVAKEVEKVGGVRTVEYGKRVGEKLSKVKYTSFIFMLFISILTGISVAVVIFNTIRLNLYRTQKKIMIYKLVGATKSFVIIPYMFAAVLEAAFSYLLAMLANHLFVLGVEKYLLRDSYFFLFTPPMPLYGFFYLLLTATAVTSAFICVYSFLIRLKSINEA
ncbi:MAG: hypothetical protein C0602_11720 [Denitrovibrio sp.]|nr:MAG: hypothetical protein C0602_11720 [Denitrovibrio sp.]